MGMEFRIVLFSLDPKKARIAARHAFQRIAVIDHALSNYRVDSELMRLCKLAEPGLPIPVGNDLFRILAISKKMHRLSGGAFEISVGPLSELWKQSRRSHRLPTEKALAEAKARVGSEWIRLDHARHTVEFLKKGILLDPGGIAKGYAVDQALLVLRNNGIDSALVDGSGDIAASASPPGAPGWKIGISARDKNISKWIYLAHGAVATSGDRFGHVVIGGKSYSHIVNPKTGLGLVDSKAVTVFHRSCTYADALATSLSVLSVDQGKALIGRLEHAGALWDLGRKRKIQTPIPLSILPYIMERPKEHLTTKQQNPDPQKDPNHKKQTTAEKK